MAAQDGDGSDSSGDISAELERLATLHKGGVLSDDEFAQAKAQVLGRE